MKEITRSLLGFILGTGVCTLIFAAKSDYEVNKDSAQEDIPTTTSYNLQTYLHDNMQISEMSELTCAVPAYEARHGSDSLWEFAGVREAKIDIVGYIDIPTTVSDCEGIYAVALPKPITYEVPQHSGTWALAPSNYVPILLIRDYLDYGVCLRHDGIRGNSGSPSVCYDFYLMNTETNDIFLAHTQASSPLPFLPNGPAPLDEVVDTAAFRISSEEAVTYGIIEAPTNFRVNPKAQ